MSSMKNKWVSRSERERMKRSQFNNEMITKQKYMVHGFVREAQQNKNVPGDILNIIRDFAHHEFYHLYTVDGQWNRRALQKQILQDCITSLEIKNYGYLIGLNETDVSPCSHSVRISVNYSDYGVTAYKSRNVPKSAKYYAMNERNLIILSCPAVTHDPDDIFCVANRFNKFIQLKEQDCKLINGKSRTSNGLPFFRVVTSSKDGRGKYSGRAFHSASFQYMFSNALREINQKRYESKK
eukprot:461208_1